MDTSSLGGASGAANEMRMMMEGMDFGSLEEMNEYISQVYSNRNERGISDFLGLSSEQMHRFLHFPFESEQVVVFPDVLDNDPKAPMMTLFTCIAEAIGENGIKATATGNLPRALCRDALRQFEASGFYDHGFRPRSMNSENDFPELHYVRVTAELAGLIKLTKNKFSLTKKYHTINSKHGNAGVYTTLFRYYCEKFNWAYGDGYEDATIIQMSFAFTLYMLKQQEQETVPAENLVDAFFRAFPMTLDEFEDLGPGYDKRYSAASCYIHRALRGFCQLTGVAEVRPTTTEILNRQYTVQPLPLLQDVVRFP